MVRSLPTQGAWAHHDLNAITLGGILTDLASLATIRYDMTIMTTLLNHSQQTVTAPRFDGQAMSPAEFAALPDDGYRYEYLKGVSTVMSPAGGLHGEIATRLARLLGNHLYAEDEGGDRGHVYDSSTGYRMPNGDVRSPDVSVILIGRLSGESSPITFIEIPPDLAVEIVSPSERYESVQQKITEYLDWGATSVWVLAPPTHTVTIHSLGRIVRLHADDTLDGGDAVPGFSCRVKAIFP